MIQSSSRLMIQRIKQMLLINYTRHLKADELRKTTGKRLKSAANFPPFLCAVTKIPPRGAAHKTEKPKY